MPVCAKGQYLEKQGCKILTSKAILEMSVQELETDGGILEMRVQKMSRENRFFKLNSLLRYC